MKVLFFSVVLAVLGATASTQASYPMYPNPGFPGLPNVDVYYASWCEGNVMVMNNPQTRQQNRFNCQQRGQFCRQEDRRVSPTQIIVHAGCWAR